jgi:hypothetical protein
VYVAYYLHWSHTEILDLDHAARAKVIGEIAAIHTQLESTDQPWR